MVELAFKNEPSGAVIDDDYRYLLWRQWGWPRLRSQDRWCLFFMLNPSTADHSVNDPTIRRCMNFARDTFHCHGLLVVNLFALRSTDPKQLRDHPDPVGPFNDDYIELAVEKAEVVVCAWGTKGDIPYHRPEGWLEDRLSSKWALTLMRKHPRSVCLGRTKQGYPRHPLYVRNDVEPTMFPELTKGD